MRRLLRQRRRALPGYQQRLAAAQVARRLASSPAWLRARSIAAYWPADGELDPRPLLVRAQRSRKAVYLPVLRPGNRLGFRRWRAGDMLRPNRYGIPEPQHGRLRPAWTIGMLILPVVGFDRRGGRLGMGGGFYDRTLARVDGALVPHRPLLAGLAHGCQEVAAVPREPWDRLLDAVVTEREWLAGNTAEK